MTTLAISAWQPNPSFNYPGTAATLRIYYSANFISSEGVDVRANTVGNKDGFFVKVNCTVSGNVLSIPSFSLICTDNPQPTSGPQATCTATIFSQDGTNRGNIFTDFTIPNSFAPSTNIGALTVFNNPQTMVNGVNQYLNRDQTIALILSLIPGTSFHPTLFAALPSPAVAPDLRWCPDALEGSYPAIGAGAGAYVFAESSGLWRAL